jgi:hypothetical protein
MGVKHVLVPNAEESTTVLLARGLSKGSGQSVAFEYKGLSKEVKKK